MGHLGSNNIGDICSFWAQYFPNLSHNVMAAQRELYSATTSRHLDSVNDLDISSEEQHKQFYYSTGWTLLAIMADALGYFDSIVWLKMLGEKPGLKRFYYF